MRKEQDIELDCADLAAMLGWIAYKGHGRVGAPDKIFLKGRSCFTVEMKKPGESQRKTQKDEQQVLEMHNVPYYVVESTEQFRKVLLIEEEIFQQQEKQNAPIRI